MLQNQHLSRDQWHPLNNPSEWSKPGMEVQPPFDVAAFQKKIDAICGTRHDQPILKLAWLPDTRVFMRGHMRQQIAFKRYTLGENVYDLPLPRWALLERIEPEQYLPDWDNRRYSKDPYTNEVFDELGEPPQNGLYEVWKIIADHDENRACCVRAETWWKKAMIDYHACHGLYRLPAEDTLERIAKVWRAALEDKTVNPEQDLRTNQARLARAKAWAEAEEEKEQKRRAKLRAEKAAALVDKGIFGIPRPPQSGWRPAGNGLVIPS